MKFRNPDTGEVFDNIQAAAHPFCARHSCFYNNCPLKDVIKDEPCERWVKNHLNEAARLMGYEVVKDDFNYYEELKSSLEEAVEISRSMKEANMDKPRICEVLEVEVDEEFTYDFGENQVNRGTFKIKADGNRYYKAGANIWNLCYNEEDLLVIINHPDRIIRKPRFTQQEVERAKAIKVIYPTAYLMENADSFIRVWDKEGRILAYKVDAHLFLSLQTGQSYTLDDIIGGAE